MSLMSIFSRSKPKLGTIEFDAKLEGITSKSAYLTQYPVEFGANMNDHMIILPSRYILTGAVSNDPLGLDLSDVGMMGAGLVSSAVGGIAGAAITGVAAYLLAGSDDTRASAAWKAISSIMESKAKFDLDTGKEILQNMMIVRLDERTRPDNEQGLVFVAELQQVRIGKSRIGQGVTSADQLAQNDPVATQGAPQVDNGYASVESID